VRLAAIFTIKEKNLKKNIKIVSHHFYFRKETPIPRSRKRRTEELTQRRRARRRRTERRRRTSERRTRRTLRARERRTSTRRPREKVSHKWTVARDGYNFLRGNNRWRLSRFAFL
jgi:hypothetical protein